MTSVDFGLDTGILFLDRKKGVQCLMYTTYLALRAPRDSVFQAVNSYVIANGLNKKEFRYLLLSYTGYGFGLNVLNRVSKIPRNSVLNRVGPYQTFSIVMVSIFKTMSTLLSFRRDFSIRCREKTLVLKRIQSADFR